MIWTKGKKGESQRKDVLWISDSFVIRRGPDNDAELVRYCQVLCRGTQDECKQHAEKIR